MVEQKRTYTRIRIGQGGTDEVASFSWLGDVLL